jgi:hypothetical protein
MKIVRSVPKRCGFGDTVAEIVADAAGGGYGRPS